MALLLSTVSVKAVEPEEAGEGGEAGIALASGTPLMSYVLAYTDVQLDYVKQVLEKAARGGHYFMFATMEVNPRTGMNHVVYNAIVFKEYEYKLYDVTGSDVQPFIRYLQSFKSLDEFPVMFRISFEEYESTMTGFETDLADWGRIDRKLLGYFTISDFGDGLDYDIDCYSHVTSSGNLIYSFSNIVGVYSDLFHFPDILERSVDYSHATTVILASFLLFALFRSLWRSIRGRLD